MVVTTERVLGMRILLVEDEAAIADLVEVYLKNDGYEVERYDNATGALAAVDVCRPDLGRSFHGRWNCGRILASS